MPRRTQHAGVNHSHSRASAGAISTFRCQLKPSPNGSPESNCARSRTVSSGRAPFIVASDTFSLHKFCLFSHRAPYPIHGMLTIKCMKCARAIAAYPSIWAKNENDLIEARALLKRCAMEENRLKTRFSIISHLITSTRFVGHAIVCALRRGIMPQSAFSGKPSQIVLQPKRRVTWAGEQTQQELARARPIHMRLRCARST